MNILIYIYVFIIGSVFASFVDAYATRLLRNESIITPRSHCDICDTPLSWYELIPVISFIILKGRCKTCKSKLPVSMLITEVVVGLLFCLVYYKYGFTLETVIGFILVLVGESVFITDFKELIILDSTILVGSILILILRGIILGGILVYKYILSGIFGFVLMFLIKIFGDLIFKRESLGGGDIKLAFLMGSTVYPPLFLLALVLGSTSALPFALYTSISKKTHELSFGPFLIIGLFLAYFFSTELTNIFDLLFLI